MTSIVGRGIQVAPLNCSLTRTKYGCKAGAKRTREWDDSHGTRQRSECKTNSEHPQNMNTDKDPKRAQNIHGHRHGSRCAENTDIDADTNRRPDTDEAKTWKQNQADAEADTKRRETTN